MMGFIIALHVLICLLLIVVILIQSGRGGGLVESLSNVESMFGTKTNAFLTRATTILSVGFFITCLSLAIMSARQGKSLLKSVKPKSATVTKQPQAKPAVTEPAKSTPEQAAPAKTETQPSQPAGAQTTPAQPQENQAAKTP
jgi:preprotein translocase subunit SecG